MSILRKMHLSCRPWLISIRYKISSMIFIVHVTRLHHNNCGIKMLEVGTMNSDYSLKVLGTPRIDAHLIRKEFLQGWQCSVTREQGAVLVMGMVLGWAVTETMCQCSNVAQRFGDYTSTVFELEDGHCNGKVDIFCHMDRGWRGDHKSPAAVDGRWGSQKSGAQNI